jgi:hypothetical protein
LKSSISCAKKKGRKSENLETEDMAKKKEEKGPGGQKRIPQTYLDIFLKGKKASRRRLEATNESARRKIEKTSITVGELEKKLQEKKRDVKKRMTFYREIKQKINQAAVKEARAKTLSKEDLMTRKKNMAMRERLQQVIRAKRLEIMKLEEKITKEKYKHYLINIDPALSYLDHVRKIKNELEEDTLQYMFQIPLLHTNMKDAEKEVLLSKGYPEGKSWQLSGLRAAEELVLNPIVNEKHFQQLAAFIKKLRGMDLKGKKIMITYQRTDTPDHVYGFRCKIKKE